MVVVELAEDPIVKNFGLTKIVGLLLDNSLDVEM